jgi:hypothetical protein
MSTLPCWICGAPADSAEHMVKASDFRSVFGAVNQNAPVFRHSSAERNFKINGAKAEVLKFRPSLCANCNNARTQPHDRAWEALASTVRRHHPPLKQGSPLPITEAFSGNAKVSMLHVHLYFVKLLGCYAVEYKVPLPLRTLAVAILGNYPHPNVYLHFVSILSNAGKSEIIVGNIRAVNRGPHTVGATWFYIVGTIGVHLTYYEPGHPRLHKSLGWHPDDHSLELRLR